VKATLAHVYEHIRAWKAMDPALAALLGFPPPPANPLQALNTQAVASKEQNGQPAPLNPEALKALNPQQRDSTGVALPKPAQPPGQ
jgi:hypothetical protein